MAIKKLFIRFCILSVCGILAGRLFASYSLCVGVFPQSEAEAMHQELAGRGYPVYVLYGENYEVRIGGYDTREKADEVAEKLKNEEKIVARVIEEEDLDQYQALSDAAEAIERDDTAEGIEVNPEMSKAYNDPHAQKIISLALDLFGHPYKYGGTSIGKGIDCSFFAQTIFKGLGIPLPRTSGEQFKTGQAADPSSLKVGDLVFFKKTYYSTTKRKKKGKVRVRRVGVTRINHVGIYIGNGEFIHATLNTNRVTISRLDEPYFVKRFAGARRVLKD
jgi:cell wall-associated NlpC family hydrolase